MWLSYLFRIRHAGRIGKGCETQEARPPSARGKSGLCGSYAPRVLLEMLVGNGPRVMRRPVMRARLVMEASGPAVMLRPGSMRPVLGTRRRRMMMGSGFGFRGSEHGRSGDCAEDGGKTKQERTAAEARVFGTLHSDILLRRSFLFIGFPMDLTLLYPIF